MAVVDGFEQRPLGLCARAEKSSVHAHDLDPAIGRFPQRVVPGLALSPTDLRNVAALVFPAVALTAHRSGHLTSMENLAIRFFPICFSFRSFATSCRNRVRSAYRSFTGGLADSWIAGSPLRARATQFSNVIPDISHDRATVGTPYPPSITCPTPGFRNFPG